MHLPPGQIHTRAGSDRSLRFTGPQHARALQNAQHLFVQVEVIGRAAGRDRPDELRDLALNQLAIPAVAGALDWDVGEANRWRTGNPACPDRRDRLSSTHTNRRDPLVNVQLRARGKEDAFVAAEDVEHLIGCAAQSCGRVEGPHRDRLTFEHFAGAQLVERHDADHPLDYALTRWTRSSTRITSATSRSRNIRNIT